MTFNRLGSVMVFLVTLAVLSSISFADSAPPPPSQVTVHLVNNGVNETNVGEIVYHCTPKVDTDTYANGGYNSSLTCSAGTCINTPKYQATECTYFTSGYFAYKFQGQNRTSENFVATKVYQRYYEYQLDVQSGKLTLIKASNSLGPETCGSAFLMFAVLAGVFVVRQN